MHASIQRNKLFIGSCMALLVTSLSFGIRAGLLDSWKYNFGLSQEQAGFVTSTAFWGFPLAIIIGGMVVDCPMVLRCRHIQVFRQHLQCPMRLMRPKKLRDLRSLMLP